jgi:hypothetical protein
MSCNTCQTTEECGCKQEALHISQVCNPIVCEVEECSETFSAGCIIYTGADILCEETILASKGTTVAQAIANISAYFCSEISVLSPLPYNALYTGLISQAGSDAVDAPTVSIPTGGNTIGSIVWTRFSAGTYRGTLVGGFTGTVMCYITQAPILASSVVSSFIQFGKITDDYIEIRVYDFDGSTLSDSRLTNASFKVERWT